MLRVYAAIFFGQEDRDAAHDLVGGLLERLVAVLARDRREREVRPGRDGDATPPQAFDVS